MDALEMLQSEHDDLRALLAKIVKTHGVPARHLFAELMPALEIHEELEQTYLYPHLRQDETAREVALEALEEHHVMDILVREIGQLKPADEGWMPKIRVLKLIAEHHIDEEEQQLFPRVRDIWDDDKCRHVGRSMEELKARRRKELQLESRPA
jgi:hemerythrin superfamily protein